MGKKSRQKRDRKPATLSYENSQGGWTTLGTVSNVSFSGMGMLMKPQTYAEMIGKKQEEITWTKDETRKPTDLDKIYCFYSEKLRWCGCGDPSGALQLMRDVLEQIHLKHQNYNDADSCKASYKRINEIFHDDYAILVSYLYMLDAHGLVEHGYNISGSWLTDFGNEVYELLSKNDLELAMEHGEFFEFEEYGWQHWKKDKK